MRSVLATAAIAVGFPSLLSAEEIGQVNAEFDGEQRQWFTIAVKRGDEQAMTASFKNSKRLSSLTVQGHPEARFTTKDVLSVNADWFGEYAPGKAPVSVEILYFPVGMSGPFYTTDQVPDAPVLTIESLDLGSEPGYVAGTFAGRLCAVPKLYEEPDLNDCKAMSGRFDTAVRLR